MNQESHRIDFRGAAERPETTLTTATTLWLGILTPPLLATLNFELSFAMTPWACHSGDHFLVNATTALLLVAVFHTGAGITRRLRYDWLMSAMMSRAGFMKVAGLLASAISFAVIIAEWLPGALHSGCQ